jgi:hypothetical protein
MTKNPEIERVVALEQRVAQMNLDAGLTKPGQILTIVFIAILSRGRSDDHDVVAGGALRTREIGHGAACPALEKG